MELEPIPDAAATVIESTRKLTRELALQIASRGKLEVDILVGIAYGLHDLAVSSFGDAPAAIEWQRTALDLFERQHLQGPRDDIRAG